MGSEPPEEKLVDMLEKLGISEERRDLFDKKLPPEIQEVILNKITGLLAEHFGDNPERRVLATEAMNLQNQFITSATQWGNDPAYGPRTIRIRNELQQFLRAAGVDDQRPSAFFGTPGVNALVSNAVRHFKALTDARHVREQIRRKINYD